MSDTIELKITAITEEENTWPPCHVGFILEWDGGSHCCRGEDEYIYFYTSDSYKKIIDCIGLRWSPMPEFSVSKEDKKEEKKDSSSKSAVIYDLMRFAEKLNLGHCIGDFEIRVPARLFDKIDHETFTETRGWTRHADGRHNCGLNSLRLYYDGSGNVLTLTKLDDGKNARPKWKNLDTLEYEKQVFLKNNIFIGSPIIFCGFRTRANRLADQNYYHLSIYNIQARGAYYNTYDIKVDKKNSWEWAEIPE